MARTGRRFLGRESSLGISLLALLWFVSQAVTAQKVASETDIPVTRGHSKASSGMFYYDVEEAEDLRHRKYVYTLCPAEATCISLQFTLLESGEKQDFIRIYRGEAPEGKPIATLGGASGDKRIQVEGDCLTFEFMRDAMGVHSAWTAQWSSATAGGDCAPLKGSPQECSNVQEICGPTYHETFRYFGNGAKEELGGQGACIKEEHNSIWYRFRIRRDGELSFLIVPDNFYDDYDWVLWKGDLQRPDDCSAILGDPTALMACNYSSAKGTKGATGMNGKGEGLQADADGNPFCRQVPVKRGEVYYLMVDDFSQHQSGFRIDLGDVVRECESEGAREFVQLGRQTPYIPWKVPPQYQFSRQTKVLRVNLDEKMNEPLATATPNGDLFEELDRVNGPDAVKAVASHECRGLVPALLEGLKAGKITALAATDFRTPLHYGDLLDVAERLSLPGTTSGSWWNPGKGAMANYGQSVELIVDDVFNRNTGAMVRQIKFIRLLWTDGEGAMPDVNVAVFAYHEVQPLLEKMAATSRHSDVASLSLVDVLEMNMFSSLQVSASGQHARTPQDAANQSAKALEFENYLWPPQ